MKAMMKSIAVLAMMAFSTAAYAGGVSVYDDGDSKLKLESLFFLNTTFNNSEQSVAGVTSTTDQSVGLSVDRAYLTAKYYFNSDWYMRLTTDVHLDTSLGKKNNNIFLKYAYVEGKLIGDALVLRLGQSHTPWIDYEEHLSAHRYITPVYIDKYGFDASSDLGIGFKGKVANGLVEYWVTETAGAGYSHPGMHKDAVTGAYSKGVKAFDLDSRISIHPFEGMSLDFQFRDGYKGTKYFDKVNAQVTPGTKHTLYQLMATYGMGHDWRIGGNYINEKADRNADPANGITTRVQKTNGYALWGWAKIPDTQFGLYGRWDNRQLKQNLVVTKEKENRYIMALEYFPVKNIAFAAVFDYSKINNPGFTLGDWTKDTKAGLYTQVKF